MSVSQAVDTLVESQVAEVPDPALARRLAEVQSLLEDDLAWLETALRGVSGEGAYPATAAAKHLATLGGKRVRPLTLLLASGCFGDIPRTAREVALVSELIHTATLLHDDVMDDGMVRRGREAARLVYGNAISVLAGDLMLVHGLSCTLRSAPELMSDLVTTLHLLVDGEVIQLHGRRQLDLSEETYERILRGKTASLFAFAARSGAKLAGATPTDQDSLGRFGEALGVAFQLVDDVLDYAGEGSGKSMATDLREGKLTLPLVLAVKRKPELLPLLHRIHAGDTDAVEGVREAVVSSGACEEVRVRAEGVTDVAQRELAGLQASPAKIMLETIAREMVARAR